MTLRLTDEQTAALRARAEQRRAQHAAGRGRPHSTTTSCARRTTSSPTGSPSAARSGSPICCAGSASDATPHDRAGAPDRPARRRRSHRGARHRAAGVRGPPSAGERPRPGRLPGSVDEGRRAAALARPQPPVRRRQQAARVARDLRVPGQERRGARPGRRRRLRVRRRDRAGELDDVGEIAADLASWQASSRTFSEDIERFPGELTISFQ